MQLIDDIIVTLMNLFQDLIYMRYTIPFVNLKYNVFNFKSLLFRSIFFFFFLKLCNPVEIKLLCLIEPSNLYSVRVYYSVQELNIEFFVSLSRDNTHVN